MKIDDNGQCRASLAELDQDRELGVDATTEEIVQDRVLELMDSDSEDEDSMVVLMESHDFIQCLRKLLDSQKPESLNSSLAVRRLMMADQLVKEAQIVLSEYVENSL